MAARSRQLLTGLAIAAACGGLALAQPPAPEEIPPDLSKAGAVILEPKEPETPVPPPKVEKVPETKQAEIKTKPAPTATTRPRFPIAIVQVVDKITTETNRFELRLDRPVQYKALVFTLHACEGSAPGEDRDFIAHMNVDFQPPTPPGRSRPARRQVFRGWMYASSPSVTPFEHPTYDAWLIGCRTDAPPPPPPAPKAAAPKAASPRVATPAPDTP